MLYERSPRGIVTRILFNDVLDETCSLQESSLAGEDCCWFGPNGPAMRTRSERLARRLHLTRNMTLMLARAMRDAARTGTAAELRFVDRYDGECVVGPGTLPGSVIRIDLAAGDSEMHGVPMELDVQTIEQLLPVLASFVANGTIQSTRDPSALDEPPAPVLDLKIARSMLGRADLGETSVSAQDLVDAFLDLYETCQYDLRHTKGHDMADRMDAMAKRIGHLAKTVSK